jgi:hypothetical protein
LFDIGLTQLSAQTLQKGNILGLHVLSIKPNPDVTFNQYMDIFTNKWVPKFEESFPGLKLFVLKGDRGENENSFGLLIIFDSVETRDKYWPKMDEPSELAQQCFEKLTPINQELSKLGTWSSVRTDWLVQ